LPKRRLADIARKGITPPHAMLPEMIGGPAKQEGKPLSDNMYSFVYKIFPPARYWFAWKEAPSSPFERRLERIIHPQE
jgi:hypothetical protein